MAMSSGLERSMITKVQVKETPEKMVGTLNLVAIELGNVNTRRGRVLCTLLQAVILES